MSESSNAGFGLTALVNEIERTAKGTLGSAAETILGDQGSCDRTLMGDQFLSSDKNNNNDDPGESATGEPFIGRGSYIPFPASAIEDTRATSPVDLQVSNLDQTIDQRKMKEILHESFSDFVTVLNVSVFFQTDGNMAACVRVGSPQEAQIAISQLHRKKLGYKRILISNNQIHNFNPNMLRSKVGAVLAEVPNGRLQLFKFREMYEKRYHEPIGVSDLYKMKDVVVITEDGHGRMIQLQPNWYSVPSQFQRAGTLNQVDLNQSGGSCHGLVPRHQSSFGQSSLFANQGNLPSPVPAVLDSAYCKIHCNESRDTKLGWAEKENGTMLPNVNVSLSVLGPNIKSMIQYHSGALPLSSLSVCYTAMYPPGLQVDNDEGVPLEHLVTCIRGVSIHQSVSGVKQLIFVGIQMAHQGIIGTTYLGRNEEGKVSSVFSHYRQLSGSSIASSASSSASSLNNISYGIASQLSHGPAAPLEHQLAHFSRELIDLLKTAQGCRMPFHKFIPAYHHHFGRQCRVADYGYTKLKDLFEALPQVVQIMGEGSRALITLAHRAQVKRFTNDLLRVLKSQPNKQISILDLPSCFEKSINRSFKISDYGVCDLEDILHEVSETTVVLSLVGDELFISIPKREQTQSEVMKTNQFAQECIELLRHAPDCRLDFNKFIPAYHHHFGRQCRVSDYGFSKLMELFEAIPMTVEITENANGERLLQLTDSERLAVLADQITFLIAHRSSSSSCFTNNNVEIQSSKQGIRLDDVEEAYRVQFGYQLRPDTYGEDSILKLLGKLNKNLRVEKDEQGISFVRLIDRSYIKAMANQVRDVLATDPEGMMLVEDFEKLYIEIHGSPPDIDKMESDLNDWVEIVQTKEEETVEVDADKSANESEDDIKCPGSNSKARRVIKLKPLQLCVIKIQNLLKDHSDKILMSEFEAAFAEKYKTALCPGQYGFPSLAALIQSPVMSEEQFLIRGSGARRMIWYTRDGSGPNLSLASGSSSQPTRGVTRDMVSHNFAFHERMTSAINNVTSQQRYPGLRSDIRVGPSIGKSWGASTNLQRTAITSSSAQFPRAIRGVQPPSGNPNRFIYPPPLQSNAFLGFSYGSLIPQQLQTQQSELGAAYWGNLARFGLFPNGSGGVAPSSFAMTNQSSSMDQLGFNAGQGMSSVCGRSLSGALVPPPPLSRLSPSLGSPLNHCSMLPTPHSPSPMMPGSGSSPFAFPPTYWPNASSPGPF